MTTFFGLIAIGLGIYAIMLQNRIDDLNEDVQSLESHKEALATMNLALNGSLRKMREQLRVKDSENKQLMDSIKIEKEMEVSD